MQIITIDNVDFAELINAFRDASRVGSYKRNGQLLVVKATDNFLMVINESSPTQISFRPTRSLKDALSAGKDLLEREHLRGSQVDMA